VVSEAGALLALRSFDRELGLGRGKIPLVEPGRQAPDWAACLSVGLRTF
jgi:hypothetical protein